MTRAKLHGVRCPVCGAENILCPHCGNRLSSSSPFSNWLRTLPHPFDSSNYDNENLDYIWFHYRRGWLITIEEKQFGAHSTRAQSDTHGVIRQLLTYASSSGYEVSTLRGRRKIEYRGHYEISFEQTCPADSSWVSINGNKGDVTTLMTLLDTGNLRIK